MIHDVYDRINLSKDGRAYACIGQLGTGYVELDSVDFLFTACFVSFFNVVNVRFLVQH